MRKKLLLVINPISGRGMIKDYLMEIVSRFSQNGYEVTVYPTKKKGDATLKMAQANEFDFIVVSGGDGTLNEAVSGMVLYDGSATMGYLPAGTTNDFAATLNIPKQIDKAMDICLNGEAVSIDVGQFNDRYFIYVAAFGAFTDVAYETPQPRKNMLGGFAYLIEGLLKLPSIHPYKCKLTYPEGTIEGEFIFGMVSNSDSVAGIKNAFGTTADLSDGLFEVILIRNPRNILDYPRILTDFLNTKYDPEYVMIFKTSQIQVESFEEMKWTLDGEAGGFYQKTTISSLPQRVKVVMGGK